MRPPHWRTLWHALPIVTLLLFVMNPEMRALLLFVDLLGVDLFLLLIAIQLKFMLNRATVQILLERSYAIFCQASRLPCWRPSWRTLLARPDMALHALPYDAMILGACSAACLVKLIVSTIA